MDDSITIFEYDKNWPILFLNEKSKIEELIGGFIVSIEHIGSTAISDLASKPIIDLLIGLKKFEDSIYCIPKLEKLNYEYVPEAEQFLPNRRFFRKPPKGTGTRKFHVHLVEFNDDFWEKQLLFRDYLRSHSEAKYAYESLKKDLAKRYKNNREAYTNGKDDFIKSILLKAKEE
ncbi:MAG: GrpB family protein [Candidatus Heimdallarchaeota archaeon]|nr:GrpB family protein [Candidatus Heimdallarchaeota archaeon]